MSHPQGQLRLSPCTLGRIFNGGITNVGVYLYAMQQCTASWQNSFMS
jgi:hypothetical protein